MAFLFTAEITERYRGNNKNVKKEVSQITVQITPLCWLKDFFAVVSKSSFRNTSRGPNSLDPDPLHRFFFIIKAVVISKTDLDISICIPLY